MLVHLLTHRCQYQWSFKLFPIYVQIIQGYYTDLRKGRLKLITQIHSTIHDHNYVISLKKSYVFLKKFEKMSVRKQNAYFHFRPSLWNFSKSRSRLRQSWTQWAIWWPHKILDLLKDQTCNFWVFLKQKFSKLISSNSELPFNL